MRRRVRRPRLRRRRPQGRTSTGPARRRGVGSGSLASSFVVIVRGRRKRVCPPLARGGSCFDITRSAREQALGAAENALLPAAAALVSEVVEVVIFRRLEQDVVARLELVDELERKRANAVPVLARRDALDVD